MPAPEYTSMTSQTPTIHIDDLRQRIVDHPLYARIRDAHGVRSFMRSHVFCVWDFQSLLKALQREFTSMDVPWLPKGDPEARRLMNEVVLEEESDIHPDGGYASHFELYLDAMRDSGADRGPIDGLIARLRRGETIGPALANATLPAGVREFVGTTFDVIATGELHRMVAVFTYTREDLIPDMFSRVVKGLAEHAPAQWSKFQFYLNRHIEIDGERHGPISHALLNRVCGKDPRLWQEAEESVRQALAARLALWDGILSEIEGPR
jgi:hypothetical protein